MIRIIRIAALLHKDDRIPGFVQSQREPYIPAGEFPQVAFRKGSTLHCTCHLSAGFCIFNRKRDRYARLEPAVEQDDASVAQPDPVDQRGAGQEQPAILHPDRITVVARLKRATAEDGSCIRTGNFQCGPLSAGEASRFDQQAAAFGLERTTDRSGMIPTVLDGQAAAFYRDRRKRFVRSRNRTAPQLEPIIARGDRKPPLERYILCEADCGFAAHTNDICIPWSKRLPHLIKGGICIQLPALGRVAGFLTRLEKQKQCL